MLTGRGPYHEWCSGRATAGNTQNLTTHVYCKFHLQPIILVRPRPRAIVEPTCDRLSPARSGSSSAPYSPDLLFASYDCVYARRNFVARAQTWKSQRPQSRLRQRAPVLHQSHYTKKAHRPLRKASGDGSWTILNSCRVLEPVACVLVRALVT